MVHGRLMRVDFIGSGDIWVIGYSDWGCVVVVQRCLCGYFGPAACRGCLG